MPVTKPGVEVGALDNLVGFGVKDVGLLDTDGDKEGGIGNSKTPNKKKYTETRAVKENSGIVNNNICNSRSCSSLKSFSRERLVKGSLRAKDFFMVFIFFLFFPFISRNWS